MSDRVRTGIKELDEMLRGGFLAGDSVMVAGSAGTGKTTLALQYIANGIKMFDENGIYVTFEQLPDQLYRDALSLGMDLRKMEDENRLRVVCTSPDLLLETGGKEHLLDGFIGDVKPQRIVIDSLSHIRMFVPESALRKETYRLLMYLKTKKMSSMFTWEVTQMMGPLSSVTDVGVSFLVDTILLLRQVEIESKLRMALAVVKMRGSDHDRRLREFELTSTGMKLASPFTQYEGVMTGSPRRVSPFTDEALAAWTNAFAKKRK